MKIWRTLAIVLVLLLATAGAVAVMFNKDEPEEISKSDEPTWDVRTVNASNTVHRPQIKLIGQVEPIADITEVAQLSAQVTNILIPDGSTVSAGDLIIQLDDFDARIQLEQLKADMLDINTQITLMASQQKLDKQALTVEQDSLALMKSRLKQQKSIANTQSAIDDLNQQIQRQEFAVLQRQAAIENHPANRSQLDIRKRKLELAVQQAERNFNNTQLTAPFDGKLAQVMVKEGQRISAGQPLFRLYSNNEMAVRVQLPARLQQQSEQIIGLVSDHNRTSQVSFLRSEAQFNPGQAGFSAWFSLSSAQQWLPGDVVNVRLSLAGVEATYSVPPTSLFQDRWIYSVDDEQRLSAIEVGVLGSLTNTEQTLLVVQALTDETDDLRLLATRLNNPTTGMKIYEQGVDPEPVDVDVDVDVDDADADGESDNDTDDSDDDSLLADEDDEGTDG